MSCRLPPRPPSGPPATSAEGAALIQAHALKLFVRSDGQAADWPGMTDALFVAAFMALDALPDDQRGRVARRVYTGAYDRFLSASAGGANESIRPMDNLKNLPSNTANLKSPRPKPPNGAV